MTKTMILEVGEGESVMRKKVKDEGKRVGKTMKHLSGLSLFFEEIYLFIYFVLPVRFFYIEPKSCSLHNVVR